MLYTIPPENYLKILKTISVVYQTCNITKLPIDCFHILKQYGFRVFTYSELKCRDTEIFELCCSYTTDSFRWENIIGYNERANAQRIRFSLMHEFGHAMLDTDSEEEADEFASHFLAPRILIHKYGYRTSVEIHDAFGLSYAASNRALFSYREWLWNISRSRPRSPSEPELQLERLFFPEVKRKVDYQPDREPERDNKPDLLDKYLIIYHLLQEGLPIPRKYERVYEQYRKIGFRLK